MSGQQGDFDFFDSNKNGGSSPLNASGDIQKEIEKGNINLDAFSETATPQTNIDTLSATSQQKPALRIEGNSYGQILRNFREQKNYSISQIADMTCIKADAITALEEENTAALPPPFYIAAYIKKLCTIYGVDENTIEEISAGVKKDLERTVPEDLSRVVRGHGVSEENEKRIRRLAILLVALFSAVAVLLISAAAVLVSHLISVSRHDGESLKITFDEDSLLKLQSRPELVTPRLPKKNSSR